MSATRYPVYLDLIGRTCVVVGGGRVALRKVQSLVEAGAAVRVVSPDVSGALSEMAGVECVQMGYTSAALDGASLVFACTDDAGTNERVWQDCRARGIWCNVADDPRRCDFFVPAVMQRGRLQVAVGTNGASPALAGTIRDAVAGQFDASFEAWLERLWEVRQQVVASVADEPERRRVLMQLGGADSVSRFRKDGLAGWQVWCDEMLGTSEAR